MLKIFFALLIPMFLDAKGVHADWSVGVGIHDRGWHEHEWEEEWEEHHPYWAYHEHLLPFGCSAMWVNGARYYYCNGFYYAYTGWDYVMVPPPVAAPVVVQQPVVISQPPVVTTVQPAPTVVQQDSFTINVPNNSGGYTAVVVRRSGGGYAGPQGEYYDKFPSVAQLKAMYGK